jgi:hypothetical protein
MKPPLYVGVENALLLLFWGLIVKKSYVITVIECTRMKRRIVEVISGASITDENSDAEALEA